MIRCADLRCKYCKKGKCTCKNVELAYWNINTTFEGRKDMLECKSFEFDNEYLEMKKKIEELLDKVICNYDGDKFELKVDKWTDYEGEQIQVKSDGKTYLLSANNCYLIGEK